MKRTLGIIAAFHLLFLACEDEPLPAPEPEEPKPTALFTLAQTAEDDPFTYSFTNGGANYTLVRWEFGDDSVSLDDSPTHTFVRTGDFRVTLRTENGQGFWAESEAMISINPDSLIEVATTPKPDGSLDLSVSSDMAIDSVFWYKGVGVGGEFLANDNLVNVAVERGQFADYTLRVKTPNGSIAEISRLLTDLGVVRDVTANGILSVSRDNDGGQFAGEGSLKLTDNDTQTKFLQHGYVGDLWWQLDFYEPVILGAYTLTSANDVPDRDPKNWKLEGSLDGENWTLLDERSDQVFETRFLTKTYTFENSTAYRYYRLSVTSVVAGGLFQIAEYRMLQLPQ
ncbi:discoidin domain-containing protein [Parapedobacter sp. DT-150]|uniref:discoidin domain-containing protein n=1 Tax=Parapedobacter sp. DT-150 TaxID=3396162 RepID=UPI003F53F3E9